MAAINDITGDAIKTKPSDTYAQGHDAIDWSVKLNTDDPLCASCGEIECKCVDK
jgi:hypothetical protein